MATELDDRGQADALRRERADQLASLTRLSEAVARAPSVEAVYAAALDCVAETLSPDRASVLVFDDDDVMRFKAWRGLSDEYRAATEGHTPWTRDTRDPAPVLVEDALEEPSLTGLHAVLEAEGIRALGFFPLVGGGRLLGKFMVYFDGTHGFTPSEVSLAQAIGAHIALELGRRQAEDELRLHAALLEAQSDLAAEGILVVSTHGRIVSFNDAFVEMWRLPPEVVAARSSSLTLQTVRELLVDPETFLERTAYLYAHPEVESREEVALTDGRLLLRHGLPIRDADGTFHGRIWFFHDVTERRLAERRAALVSEASRVLGGSLDHRATLRGLAEAAVGFMGEVCVVDLVEDGELRRVALAGARPELVADGAVARALETGAAQVDSRSIVVPLRARTTVGAIAFAGRSYDEHDVDLARDLAQRAAVAAENGLLHEAEQRARNAAERLQAVTGALARSLTRTEIAHTVVREGAAALGATAGWLAAVDEGRGELRRLAAVGYQPRLELAYAALPLDLVNPTVDAVRYERALWLESADDVAAAYPALDADYRATGFEAMAVVPLRITGRSTGVIALNFAEPKVFREDERQLLLALAAQCGQALERATLYARLQERADAASALAHVGDGVFQLDPGERVLLWNRGAEVLTGIAEPDAVGRSVRQLFDGWDEIRPRISITETPVAVGRREALPVRARERELLIAISGVATADGVVYAFRDVTEAEQLEKARRDFLATASHELRTPLAGVFGATKTLLSRDLDEHLQRQLLQVIDRESQRLAHILDDILFASRLDADRIELQLSSCDLVELARETIELERARLPAGLTLTLDAPPTLPRARADATKVRQVLLNLLDNAIKYSPEGGAVVVSLSAGDGVVGLSIADDGLGIPATARELVFEKFFRLDPGLSRGVGGTGLGLYICREFVDRMGGRIWVSSSEGGGSTFHVELPVSTDGAG